MNSNQQLQDKKQEKYRHMYLKFSIVFFSKKKSTRKKSAAFVFLFSVEGSSILANTSFPDLTASIKLESTLSIVLGSHTFQLSNGQARVSYQTFSTNFNIEEATPRFN